MYMSNIDCGCNKKRGLSGLSDASTGAAVGTAVGSAYGPVGAAVGGAIGGALFGGGDSGGASAGSAPGLTVATNVNTQVSPQISPSFVQQDHPTDSPVTTTALSSPSQTQTLPPLPVTGAIPGIDNTPNPYAYLPTVPPAPATILGMNAEYVALGAAGLLVFAMILKKRKQNKKSV